MILSRGTRPSAPPAIQWWGDDYRLVGSLVRRPEAVRLIHLSTGAGIDLGSGYLPRTSSFGGVSYIAADANLVLIADPVAAPSEAHRIPLAGGEEKTRFFGCAWAPDGRRIALARRVPPPAEAARDPFVDTPPLSGPGEASLEILEIATGLITVLHTLPNLCFSGNIAWSYDGESLYVDAEAQRIYRIDARTGTASVVSQRAGGDDDSLPGFVPIPRADGTDHLLLTVESAPAISMWSHVGLAVCDVATGEMHPFIGEMRGGQVASAPVWSETHQLAFTTVKFGAESPYSRVVSVDRDGHVRRWTNDASNAGALAIAPSGARVAWHWRDASGRSGLRSLDIASGAVTDVPHSGDNAAAYASGDVETVNWRGADGLSLSGLLFKPARHRPGQRYPLMVALHGGPNGGIRLEGSPTLLQTTALEWHLWAQSGLFVFLPVSRGSGLYGWQCIADARDAGSLFALEAADIDCGIEEIMRREPIDAARVLALGCSYGAIQAAYHITRHHRFRAAILYEGMYDWYAFCTRGGDTSGTDWMFKGRPRDVPERYLAPSAIRHSANVTASVLLISGERGIPLAPTRLFRDALVEAGVDVTLLVYPGEGHVIRSSWHQRDLLMRTFSWVGERLDMAIGVG